MGWQEMGKPKVWLSLLLVSWQAPLGPRMSPAGPGGWLCPSHPTLWLPNFPPHWLSRELTQATETPYQPEALRGQHASTPLLPHPMGSPPLSVSNTDLLPKATAWREASSLYLNIHGDR